MQLSWEFRLPSELKKTFSQWFSLSDRKWGSTVHGYRFFLVYYILRNISNSRYYCNIRFLNVKDFLTEYTVIGPETTDASRADTGNEYQIPDNPNILPSKNVIGIKQITWLHSTRNRESSFFPTAWKYADWIFKRPFSIIPAFVSFKTVLPSFRMPSSVVKRRRIWLENLCMTRDWG